MYIHLKSYDDDVQCDDELVVAGLHRPSRSIFGAVIVKLVFRRDDWLLTCSEASQHKLNNVGASWSKKLPTVLSILFRFPDTLV